MKKINLNFLLSPIYFISVFLLSDISCHLRSFKFSRSDSNPKPVVMTTHGAVMGSSETSRSGRVYLSFRSIPFAQPPLGLLRFASPRAVVPWFGVRNVSEEAPYCVQYNLISLENFNEDSFFGQEDCLYLSVFTHKTDVSRKRPVMVYIHGGGFESWTGARMNGPEYFMDHDIVTVFVNYRLGPFGFLSTEDSIMPGNFGLKDQLLALKWIRDNIALFGGDAESVTLFGESAGAASVNFHMKSIHSRGLFHRAIMNSGSLYCPWALLKAGEASKRAVKAAEIVGCPTSDSKALIICLRNKSTADIIKTRLHFSEWDTDPATVFGPVTERPGGFFTDDDLNRKTNVTLMTGLTSHEGAIKVAALLSRKVNYVQQLISEFNKWAPLTFGYGQVGQHPDISQSVKRHYFKNMDVSSVNDVEFMSNLTQAYSDSWFARGLYTSLKEHRGKLYRYKLERKPQVSFVDIIGAKFPPGVNGASHADDLFYFFNMTKIVPVDPLNEEDKAVSRILVKIWSDFIITGAPGGIWKPTTDNEVFIITSDGSFNMSTENKNNYSVDFWHHLENFIHERSNQVRNRG